MQGSDELLTIAELAIGLAGFSGVVVAFGYRGKLEEVDRYRFIALLGASFITAILAFVPLLLNHAGFGNGPMWRLSSAIAITAQALYTPAIVPRLPRAARRSEAGAPASILAVTWALSGALLLLQAANALAWPFAPGPLPYLLGLLIWLLWSAILFGFLVLFRPREPAA
jgi:hypothetical protein